MVRRRTGRKIARVGLDIGAGGVRAARLARKGDAWRITGLSEVLAEGGRDLFEAGSDAPAMIRTCLSRFDSPPRRVNVALCPPDVEVHALELPVLDDSVGADLATIARVEMERLAPRETESLLTGVWAVPKGTSRSPTAMGVATPREKVSDVLELCEGAEVTCDRVDALPCALSRFLSVLMRADDSRAHSLLDFGARQARLIVCVGATPVLLRKLADGGTGWTQRIADALKISTEAAEIHKRDNGIEPSGRGVRTGEGNLAVKSELASILFGVLRKPLSKLVTEVERSYSYVVSCYPSCKVGDLVLVGGGSQMRGLDEYLGETLGMKVRRACDGLNRPNCRLEKSESVREPIGRFATAIGLAMEPTV